MEGSLIIAYAGKKEFALEFAKMIFSYPEVILATIGNFKDVDEYALKNQKQVINLQSVEETQELFGADQVFYFGKEGAEFDLNDVGGDLKEGKSVMFVFGSEKSDTTLKKWTGDIGAATIILYELDKLVNLGR